MCSEPGLSVFQATERMQYLAYAEVLNKTLASFGGIALALLGFGVVAIAGFTAAAGVLLLVLTVVWARQLAGLDLSVTFRGLRELAAASLPYWITGIFFMVYLWIDAVMLGLLVPAEVVGWYGAATKLFTTLMFVPVLLATAWLPRLVRAYVEGGDEQLSRGRARPGREHHRAQPAGRRRRRHGRGGRRPAAVRRRLRRSRGRAGRARALRPADVPEHPAEPGAHRRRPTRRVGLGPGRRDVPEHRPQLAAHPGAAGAFGQRCDRLGPGAAAHGAGRGHRRHGPGGSAGPACCVAVAARPSRRRSRRHGRHDGGRGAVGCPGPGARRAARLRRRSRRPARRHAGAAAGAHERALRARRPGARASAQ